MAALAGCGGPRVALDAALDAPTSRDADAAFDAPDGDVTLDSSTPIDAGSDAAVECGAPTLRSGAARGGDAVVLRRAGADSAPSVMLDGVYRMWWCGTDAGRARVLYAEADALDGPWHAHGAGAADGFDVALSPTGGATDFDGAGVCDPSVVRVDGAYYLYYTGDSVSGAPSAIGLATSADGLAWTRLPAGQPVVAAARPARSPARGGAARPSVVYVTDAYYLFYGDTTGFDSGASGGGVYVWRSADPAFNVGVTELGAAGFVPYTGATHTRHALLDAVSVDVSYSDLLGRFVLAQDVVAGRTSVVLYDRALGHSLPAISIMGAWADAPGLVTRPDRHAQPSVACGVLPLDVVRPVGTPGSAAGWDLAHVGLDVATHLACACANLPAVFDGELVTAAGQPLSLVRDGARLQFGLDVGYHFARTRWPLAPAAYALLPYGATLPPRADVITVDNTAWAFLLDDGRGWQTDCIGPVTDDEATARTVPATVYNGVPRGPDLHCLR